MTQPVTAEELEADADQLEDQAAEAAGGPLLVAALALLGVLTSLYVLHGLTSTFRDRMMDVLNGLPSPVDPAKVRPLLVAAATLGARVVDRRARNVEPSRRALEEILSAPARTMDRLDQARLMADLVQDFDDIVRVAAAVRNAAETGPRSAQWAINRAIADATTAHLDRLGLARMWVAEPGACPKCRPLHGQIAPPGQPFLAVEESGVQSVVDNPPRHPGCRCRVWLAG